MAADSDGAGNIQRGGVEAVMDRYAEALRLRRAGKTYREIGAILDPQVTGSTARVLVVRAERREREGPKPEKWTDGLPNRIADALLCAGFQSRDEVLLAIDVFPRLGRAPGMPLEPFSVPNIGNYSESILRAWLGLPEPPEKNRAASEKTISNAVKLLERYGYRVVPPVGQPPDNGTAPSGAL